MLENFRRYLIEQGYSEFTPTEKPSTVYDYASRIERICSRENIKARDLAENISFYVEKYGPTGIEAEYGKKSHNAVISALRKFEDFVK